MSLRTHLSDEPLLRCAAEDGTGLVVAAGLVAPFISIVDKSIIANASGRQPLVEGLKEGLKTLFTKPLYFFRQPAFLLIWYVESVCRLSLLHCTALHCKM